MIGTDLVDLSTFVTGLFAFFGAIVGAYLTQRYEEKRYKKQENKYIRDERKIAYKNLLSMAHHITSSHGNDDPTDFNEFNKKAFDNIAEFSLIASQEVGYKFMEIKSRYHPLKGEKFYMFLRAIIDELFPLMYDEINGEK